jgi:hypothetical protein
MPMTNMGGLGTDLLYFGNVFFFDRQKGQKGLSV